MRPVVIAFGLLFALQSIPALAAVSPAPAWAAGFNEGVISSAIGRTWTHSSTDARRDPLRVIWKTPASAPVEGTPVAFDLKGSAAGAAAAAGAAGAAGGQTFHRPVVYSYPPGFYMRRKVHVYASIAMLPLFVTEAVLGTKLYNHPYEHGLRHAHGFVALGIYGLFGLNSVTGIWNLWDERKDPHDRTVRTIHGILMLAAAAAMVGTAATTPKIRRDVPAPNFNSRETLHIGWAATSMSLATAGYLVMLLFNH